MLKTQLEVAVEQYREAARHAVRGSRDPASGLCRMCRVKRGVQHREGCHLWPLIEARIEHELADTQDTAPEEAEREG